MWLFGGNTVDANPGDLVAVRDGGAGLAEDAEVIAWLKARGYRVTRGARTKVREPGERRRLSEQCRQILAFLRQRGAAGCWNDELARIALKYTGRISEIRGAGFEVEIHERKGPRRRYVLTADPVAGAL